MRFFKLCDLCSMSFYSTFQGTHAAFQAVDLLGDRQLFNNFAVLLGDQLNFGDNSRFDYGVYLIDDSFFLLLYHLI